MHASNHVAVKAASAAAGIAAVLAAAWVADLAARHYDLIAGAALIVSVFAACWVIRRFRLLLHPVPLARRSGIREADVTAEPPALAGTATAR